MPRNPPIPPTPVAPVRQPSRPACRETELVSRLLAKPGLTIERIVSTGQASPPDFWYDQERAEWVVLLQGDALLRFADEAEPRCPQGRVSSPSPPPPPPRGWTASGQTTVWLAIHYDGAKPVPIGQKIGENSGFTPAFGVSSVFKDSKCPTPTSKPRPSGTKTNSSPSAVPSSPPGGKTGRPSQRLPAENTAGKLLDAYGEKSAEELEGLPVEVKVAGRMMLKRVMGKASLPPCRTFPAASGSTSPGTRWARRLCRLQDTGTWATFSASSGP